MFSFGPNFCCARSCSFNFCARAFLSAQKTSAIQHFTSDNLNLKIFDVCLTCIRLTFHLVSAPYGYACMRMHRSSPAHQCRRRCLRRFGEQTMLFLSKKVPWGLLSAWQSLGKGAQRPDKVPKFESEQHKIEGSKIENITVMGN